MGDGNTRGLPQPGAIIGGRYRIERLLGSGGMGVVFAAADLRCRSAVAIKFVPPGVVDQERLSTRLLHEASVTVQMQSEHFVRVFDVNRLADGTAYMVMERLWGCTLRRVLDQGIQLRPRDVMEHAIGACEALTEIHSAGIVHRDIKPSNLYLAGEKWDRRKVRLLDFGVCQTEHSKHAPRRSPNSRPFVGTPRYVSPEQLACPDEADARSDLWSLGVVIYECLAGRVPFNAPSLSLLWRRIMLEPAPRFEPQHHVPAALEQIVLRCLAKESEQRFSSALELADALRAVRARLADTRIGPFGVCRVRTGPT